MPSPCLFWFIVVCMAALSVCNTIVCFLFCLILNFRHIVVNNTTNLENCFRKVMETLFDEVSILVTSSGVVTLHFLITKK